MMARAKRTRGQQQEQQQQQEQEQQQKQQKFNDGKFSDPSKVLNSEFARSAALLVEISQRLARMNDRMDECFDRIEKRMIARYVIKLLKSALTFFSENDDKLKLITCGCTL